MKKILTIGLVALGVVALAGFGAVGLAGAADKTTWAGSPPTTRNDVEGPLHDYMIAAFAEALNLTPEKLEARLEAGETLYEIAEAQGIPADQIRDVLRTARDKAIDAALADGVISQKQADWMKTRGFGHMFSIGRWSRGFCHGDGIWGGMGMRRGGRWSQNRP